MPLKIFIAEGAGFQIPVSTWAGAQAFELNKLKDTIPGKLSGSEGNLVIGPSPLRYEACLEAPLRDPSANFCLLLFSRAEDAVRLAPRLFLCAQPNRTIGIKDWLTAGSTIYSEAIFNAGALGAKLDHCYAFALQHLAPAESLATLNCIQAAAGLGLQSLLEKPSEKVGLQIGQDQTQLAFSVQFPLAPERLAEFRRHPLLEVARTSAHFYETRYLHDAQKFELTCLFFREARPERTIECHSIQPLGGQEDPLRVKEYQFLPLSSLANGSSGSKAVPAGSAFKNKKKFSEQVQTANPRAGGPTVAALENQIVGLEHSIAEKDQVITRLSKDVSDQRDAAANSAMTVDREQQLKSQRETIQRLEQDLAKALLREKESAKPVEGSKEDLAKKLKETEFKLKAAIGESLNKTTSLEKQLEEQKRQNKELIKKLNELSEQTRKKAA